MDRVEDLKTQVQLMVAEIFSAKEEEAIRKSTEEALQESATTIADLTSSLETKTDEVASLEEKLSESESAKKELEEQLEAANEELTKKGEELASITQEIEDMKKDRAAENRMAELEDAGVANTDREAQTAKVREMTDEDFASYKDELVSIRESVIAELDRAKAEADAKAEEEAKKAEEEAAQAEETDEGEKAAAEEGEESASEEETEEKPAPAEIAPGLAAQAALNLETVPSADVKSKYEDLGRAMASAWTKSE